MDISRLSISARILGIIALLSTLTVGVGLFASTRLINTEAQYSRLLNGDQTAALEVVRAVRELTAVSRQSYKLLSMPDEKRLQEAHDRGIRNFGQASGHLDRTREAAPRYAARIAAIQQASGGAVAATTEITRTIAEINEIATSIAAAVEEQDAATREIARNVQQAAIGTAEIAGNIGGVRLAVESTSGSATDLLTSASELTREADDLRHQVEGFIARVRAG